MELQPFTFFAKIERIKEPPDLFEIFKKEGFYFYYFQSNKVYYIFVYGESHLSNFFKSILPYLVVIEELDTKKRKIRSIRGFLLYALEIIKDEKLITVLETNFQPLFWSRLKDVLRQNKQGFLVRFLFESSNSTPDQKLGQLLDEKMEIQTLVIKDLQEKMEIQTLVIKDLQIQTSLIASLLKERLPKELQT